MFSISCNLFSSETGGAEKVEIGGGALAMRGHIWSLLVLASTAQVNRVKDLLQGKDM